MTARQVRFTVGLLALLWSFGLAAPGGAQKTEDTKALNSEVVRLYRAGKFSEAIPIAKRALAISEKEFGPEHPGIRALVDNLASLYEGLGRYTDAEPLYRRSLSISERARGPEHSDVAKSLSQLADLYEKQGRHTDAELHYRRSLGIREKTLGRDHPDVAQTLNNLGGLYRDQDRFAEAEPLYNRALKILEKALGPDHAYVGVVLNNLALSFHKQLRLDDAEPLYKRSLAIREKALGPDHPDVANSLANLAALYEVIGRHGEAEPLHKRSLAIREKALGPDHSDVAHSLETLGSLYLSQGRYGEAEPLLQRSVKIREKVFGLSHPHVADSLVNLARLKAAQGHSSEAEQLAARTLRIREEALGPDHPHVANSLNGLAEGYRVAGRFVEAEPLYKRALVIHEKAFGSNHRDVGAVLNNLALLYGVQGRFGEAEALFKRSLEVREAALGPDDAEVGISLNNLAGLYKEQGRHGEAEPLLKRGLALVEKALGPNHPKVAVSLNNLAGLFKDQARYAEAEPLYKRSLALREAALGPDHPDVAATLNNMAVLYDAQRRYGEAEALYVQSSLIVERVLGPHHPNVATSLSNLAGLAAAQRDWMRAADYGRRSTAVIQRRFERNLSGAGHGEQDKGEVQRLSSRFLNLVKVTHQLGVQDPSRRDVLARDMLETAQWAQASEASGSLAQMAARSAKGSPVLAVLVRERQDLAVEWQIKDKQLITAKSEPPAARNPANERTLSDRLGAIEARLGEIDARFSKDFPDYSALSGPKPISIGDIQAMLSAHEALVVMLDTPELRPIAEETFIWVVTKTDVRWARSDLGTTALVHEVAALRCGLDAMAWWAAETQCPKLKGVTYTETEQEAGRPLPFDTARAFALYRSLFSGVEDALKGKHLLIVPSGALTTLPFQVLVTRPTTSPDLKSAAWLIRDHAITVLPSVASLASLRRIGKPSAATKPMIGFGNPLLDGDQRHPEHGAYYMQQAQIARAQTGCAAAPTQRTAALRTMRRSAITVPQTTGLADLAHLRAQAPLPETADELCAVARSVGADFSELRIGARATEAEIKWLSVRGDLAKYRIVHFATHGLLAGQLTGTREPGLILSPPETATAEDDGYLSGSEIAALKLDADWVILSACNTAGGAGPGEAAEALSGLARMFFYAQARALLVSHWEVDSDATVKLITAAIGALTRDSSLGRAEALRRAILTVMTDTSRPANWVPAHHPSVWAPFVVVGEGGSGG